MVHDKIQEVQIELEDSDVPKEKEVLVNEIETQECVLGLLDNLKDHDDDETQAIEIAV